MADDSEHDKNHPSGPTLEDAKEGLFRSIKSSDDPQVRRYATFFLGQLKDKNEIEYLTALLRDPDKGVREQATMAIVETGEPAVDLLIVLLDDPDWKVRYRAAEALGLMHSQKAVPCLISKLGDGNDHVRYMAAKSLGEIGDCSAEQPLIQRLGDDNEFVRRISTAALAKLGRTPAKGEPGKDPELKE
jgi:HEAT repeat protein